MGKFKPGSPKIPGSGRQKGTPNKATSLLETCKEMGFDPFKELIKFAQTGGVDGDEGLRFNALKEVAQYILPKRKAIEHSGNISAETLEASEEIGQLTKEQQIALLEAQLDVLKGDNGS